VGRSEEASGENDGKYDFSNFLLEIFIVFAQLGKCSLVVYKSSTKNIKFIFDKF